MKVRDWEARELISPGSTIFYGPATRALPYFAERGLTCPQYINPADFMLDLMDPEEEADPTGKHSVQPLCLKLLGSVERAEDHLALIELPDSFRKSEDCKKVEKEIQTSVKFSDPINSIVDVSPNKGEDYGKKSPTNTNDISTANKSRKCINWRAIRLSYDLWRTIPYFAQTHMEGYCKRFRRDVRQNCSGDR